jgi:hypothetical protein
LGRGSTWRLYAKADGQWAEWTKAPPARRTSGPTAGVAARGPPWRRGARSRLSRLRSRPRQCLRSFRPCSASRVRVVRDKQPRVLLLAAKVPAHTHFSFPWGTARDLHRDRRSSAPRQATKDAYLQDVLDGSDGTRTRDLRRDRPSQARRRSATIPSVRHHLQALLPRRLMLSAWLNQSSNRRLGHEWAAKSCLLRQRRGGWRDTWRCCGGGVASLREQEPAQATECSGSVSTPSSRS